jgi:hypothetical protein
VTDTSFNFDNEFLANNHVFEIIQSIVCSFIVNGLQVAEAYGKLASTVLPQSELSNHCLDAVRQ